MSRTTFKQEQALNRAARRLEELAEACEVEAMRVLVKLTPDPERPGCCRGWEATYNLPDEDVRSIFEADEWQSWGLAQSEEIEQYEGSSGAAEAYRRAAEVVREEASA